MNMAKSSIEKVGGETAIASVINKFGDKLWFQIIIAFWLVIGPILFVANPFINNYLDKKTSVETNKERIESHRTAFEYSKQAYAVVKKTMNDYLPKIGCDYIFLIEYHNGNENVMTGIQFCRFDMTIQASSKDLSYIPVDKFKDDIVARYDILLSNELAENKLLFYTADDFEKVDRYLAYQLTAINAKEYAVINLINKNNKVFGSLLCISDKNNKQEINQTQVLMCAREIETTFNNIKL